MKTGKHYLSLHVLPCARPTSTCRIVFFFLVVVITWLSAARSSAQAASGSADTLRGIVINSVTSEPIARALVYSPDNRFATLTNSEGRFEFTVPNGATATDDGLDSNISGRTSAVNSNRAFVLLARKPGFLADPSGQGQNLQSDALQELTLVLVPDILIVGNVTLPTSEAPDSITVQIFRRQVLDGRAHYVRAGEAQSKSDGEFRFADLPAGTYRLLTQELLDRDPLTADAPARSPRTNAPRAPLFGYPPVYYQNASDFGSSSPVQLGAGQTQTVNLSLVKQPYYRVKVPVILPGNYAPENGVAVRIYTQGRRGPGFSLGYNSNDRAIEGMLPNGTYTLEASSFGPNGVSGLQTIAIKGSPIDGPSIALVPNASIQVNVKEEFTSADNTGQTVWNINGRNTVMKGPRRYLNVMLEPADDFARGQQRPLRDPTKPGDTALVIASVPPGRYWVKVNSSRGYPSSIRSGDLDLQHQPLVVNAGGASPIEITMRDDTAEISGTVEGVTPPGRESAGVSGDGAAGSYPVAGAGAHIYCIPLPDSPGQFSEISANPDGSFVSQGLAPGAYLLLAFDRTQTELEYRNPQAMQAYDSKGPVVRVVGGQKENVRLQVISSGISADISASISPNE